MGILTIEGEAVKRVRIECNPYFVDNAEDWLHQNGYTINGKGAKYLGNEQWDNSVVLITAYKIDKQKEHMVCARSFMPCSCSACLE